MPELVLLACQAVLALAFALSLAHKASSFADFRLSLPRILPVPGRLARPVAVATIAAEATAVTLLVTSLGAPRLAGIAFGFCGALLAILTAAVVVMIRRGVTEPCHCFGISTRPPGPRDLIRNLLLLGVAAGGGQSTSTAQTGAGFMEYPQMVVGFVAALGIFNAAIAVVLLVKLNRQIELMRMTVEGVDNPKPIMLTAGDQIGPFEAVTEDGQTVSRETLGDRTLVAFLSPTCPACAENLPAFILRAMDAGRERTLAILEGRPEAVGAMRDKLVKVARVVVEPEFGPIYRAFKVEGFPAFALLSGDSVTASHFALDRFPELE